MKATFRKEERLCRKKTLEQLFQEGNSFSEFPIRVVWLPAQIDSPYPAQVAMAVPKRRIRKAVKRNHIKRLMREAYRQHKALLYDALSENGHQLALMLIYVGKEKASYKQVESKIILSLQRLIREHEQGNK